jgi:hypothetical protein
VDTLNSLAKDMPHSQSSAIGNPVLRPLRHRNLIARCVLALATLLLVTPLHAQDAHPTESQVKAAYLYNFGKFVRWPEGRSAKLDSLAICILGKDPFGAVLDSTVAGENIDGRKITVKRLSSIQETAQCSVLFVSSSEERRLAAILPAAQRLSMLTVSDMQNFAQRGGAIGLLNEQGKIRFEVNRTAAEQSHLVLSSELLKVAIKVIDKPIPGS